MITEFGSISNASCGRFVAYDTIRRERLYVQGKGITIRYFDTEKDARKALDDLFESQYKQHAQGHAIHQPQ